MYKPKPVCGKCGATNEPHLFKCSECGAALFIASVGAAPMKSKAPQGGAQPHIKRRTNKRRYNDSPYRCRVEGCGHSIDLHGEKGCKVTDIMTGEPCGCEGFKR